MILLLQIRQKTALNRYSITWTWRCIGDNSRGIGSRASNIYNPFMYSSKSSILLFGCFPCCIRFDRMRCTGLTVPLHSFSQDPGTELHSRRGLRAGTLRCCILPGWSCCWDRCLGRYSILLVLDKRYLTLFCYIYLLLESSIKYCFYIEKAWTQKGISGL